MGRNNRIYIYIYIYIYSIIDHYKMYIKFIKGCNKLFILGLVGGKMETLIHVFMTMEIDNFFFFL